MTFLLGLEQLGREEKILLLSQIEVLNSINLFNDTAQKYTKKGKDFLLTAASSITKKFSDDISKKIDGLNQKTDWDPEILKKKIEQKQKELAAKSDSVLNEILLKKLNSIADFKDRVTNEIIANGIVHRAAKSLKIDHRLYLNSIALEESVFEECVKEQIEMLKKNINKMNKEELDKMEQILTEELNKLSAVQQDAIKNTLKIDDISGKAMITFIKTVSTTAIVQMVLSGFGFGFFLFLTTMLKAFSLLIGVTFSFGAYSALTSAFGFILSLPFLFISILISGGIITKLTNSKIDDEISKLLILVGHCNLL